MNRPAHPGRAPDVPALLAAIESHGVRGVLAGSVATRAWGAALVPGDLDLIPALDRANLERLAALLTGLEASISGRIGHWTPQPSGEHRWIEAVETPAQHAARAAAWRPDPDDVDSFDHLFYTRLGNFDTPPWICGTYEALNARAFDATVGGCRVRIAHPEDLLATLTAARRARQPERVRALEAALREGRAPGD